MNTTESDLCIIGAGIAGLNAAFVASQYLGKNGKVILVDRRTKPGGMWVDTYDYVRLHQPHPMFTAGNIKWTLGRERSYLAAKPEVLDHFAHCLNVIRQRTDVDVRWGWEYVSHEVANGSVDVTLRKPDGHTEVVRAKRLIKAHGLDIPRKPPLETSSTRVQSVSPNDCDVRGEPMRSSTTPVWIIGSGKTAMDTAFHIITAYPGRQVNLVSGSGTYFINRDQVSPTGLRRWVGGTRGNKVFRDVSLRFDGTNENACRDWYRTTYANVPTTKADHFMFGMLSENESRIISDGLGTVIEDHLVDAVDRDGSVELQLRSGATATTEPGSWIVNCTGYLVQNEQPYEPYSSGNGSVLSIQTRSSTIAFSSFAAYFLTHLMFLDKLATVPLYEIDMWDMYHASQDVLPWVMATQVQYNVGLLSDALPPKVFLQCGLDFDNWYPLPRKLAGVAAFMATYRRDRAHNQRSLDTVHERFNVRCGTLEPA